MVCLPYVVLDELDRLKDRKMGDGKYIALYAQSAIRFVNAELSDATSVVRLQSVKEAKQVSAAAKCECTIIVVVLKFRHTIVQQCSFVLDIVGWDASHGGKSIWIQASLF